LSEITFGPAPDSSTFILSIMTLWAFIAVEK